MAGTYADAPGNRIAYDIDGTVMTYFHEWNGGLGRENDSVPQVDLTALQKQRLNTEQTLGAAALSLPQHSGTQGSRYLTWVFPERREIDGVFASLISDTFNTAATEFQYSTDSLGGRDGSWTTDIANVTDYYDSTYTNFRDQITSAAINNAAAVRQKYAAGAGTSSLDSQGQYHLYGTIAPSETPERLIFLDSENSDTVFTRVLDYGDVPKGQVSVRTVKVINNGSETSFSNVSLQATDLYLNAATWYEFSETDGAFETPLDLGTLGPGASKTIYMKQQVPSGETSGVQTARLELTFDPVVT